MQVFANRVFTTRVFTTQLFIIQVFIVRLFRTHFGIFPAPSQRPDKRSG
jgi:hypothetical protein